MRSLELKTERWLGDSTHRTVEGAIEAAAREVLARAAKQSPTAQSSPPTQYVEVDGQTVAVQITVRAIQPWEVE